ncbi:MAG: hypothetical protein ACM3ZE_14550, partial [Myxococcales bacterium]
GLTHEELIITPSKHQDRPWCVGFPPFFVSPPALNANTPSECGRSRFGTSNAKEIPTATMMAQYAARWGAEQLHAADALSNR